MMDVKSLIILICFSILILNSYTYVECDFPYGLCANPACSEPIGKGKTSMQYISPDDVRINVFAGEEVEIYVKEYGPKKDLLGILVRGNRGYISKAFIREGPVFHRNLVPAEIEFKFADLANSHMVTNQLHASSHHHRSSNSIPNFNQHIGQQHETVHPTQSEFHSQFINPNENLQSSQFHPKGPENLHFRRDFPDSAYDIPEFSHNFSPDYEDMLLFHDSSRNPEVNMPNKLSNLNPSNSYDYYSSESIHHGSSISNQIPPSVSQNEFQPSGSMQENRVQPSPSMNQLHQQSGPQQQFSQHMPSSQHAFHQSSSVQEKFPHSSSIHNPQPNTQKQNIHLHPSIQQQSVQQPSSMQQQNNAPQSDVRFNQHLSNVQNQYIDPRLSTEQHQSLDMQQQTINPHLAAQRQNIHQPLSMQQQTIDPHLSEQSSNFQQTSNMQEENIDPHISVQQDNIHETVNMQNFQDSDLMDEVYAKTYALLEQIKKRKQGQHLPESSQNTKDMSKESISEVDTSHFEQTEVPNVVNENKLDPSDSKQKLENDTTLLKHFEDDTGKLEQNVNKLDTAGNEGSDIDANKELDIDESDGEDDDESEINSEKKDGPIENTILNSKNAETSQDINLEPSMSSSYQKEVEISATTHDSNKRFSVRQDSNLQIQQTGNINEKEVLLSDDGSFILEENDVIRPMKKDDENISPEVSNYPERVNISNPSEIDNFLNLSGDGGTSIMSNNFSSGVIADQRFDSENKNFEGENISNLEKNDDTLHGQDSDSVAKINEIFGENEINVDRFVNTLDIDGSNEVKTTYQVRNLKEDFTTTTEEPQQATEDSLDENATQIESDFFASFQNGLNALRSILDFIMTWIPEPLYSSLTDLQTKGISPRVPVFTFICGVMIIFLIVPLYYIKEFSKETKLSARLASAERDVYKLSATNSVLEENLQASLALHNMSENTVKEEIKNSELLKSKFQKLTVEFENTRSELHNSLEEIEALRIKENDYLNILTEREKQKQELLEEKITLEKLAKENEDTINSLTDQVQETEETVKELEKENAQYLQLKTDYEEKLSQFERNCNQLLQEAEVWNLRVNELNDKVKEEKAAKDEVELSLKEKEEEMESLKQVIEKMKAFEELEDPEEKEKTKEEKLQTLLKTSMIINQLNKQIQENKEKSEQLEKEKNKILDMEVELLEAKSEIDKLKLSYNQALQDKAEAQTKLDVLTNYFKDKEIQLQKQLGVQEAVRQKKEEDATSAERRIILIEQENASYKYQVASMKQEMEETERNLKSQIAVQEKKAHENWIAARAAERKLEETKQEITQLRQRLTLLEREHENWVNTSRDEIVRPVPKRIPGVNDEPGQELNMHDRGMFPPPHERFPPHMLLPPDRPLPPPFPPMFMPPIERFRPPWHLPPDPQSDFRPPLPEFIGGRESTPPRGRQFGVEGDTGPHASSPITTDTRDSVNSTPPHLLPDFHDIPPPGRPPYFPPPHLGHHRLPMHPPFRRDMGPPPKRPENPNEYNSRGPQSRPPPPEEWQQSRV